MSPEIKEILFYTFLGLFLFALAVQIFYFLFFYLRFLLYKTIEKTAECKPVSVIISARNEDYNLERYLTSILEQDYHEFEVIVINDGSDDDTEDVLKRFENKYKNLVIRKIPQDSKLFFKGKKLAITIGVKAAKHDIILLTDADCQAVSDRWIYNMQKHFVGNKEIVLGYSTYSQGKGLLNRIIQYDTFITALNYFSYALAGVPYMGVGRNLAYTKSVFNKNNGFAGQSHIHSGDDDLFVNKAADKNNIAVEFRDVSHIITRPERSFKEWIIKKRRHMTSGKHYKWKHKFLLVLEPMTRVILYCCFIPLLFVSGYNIYAAGLLMLKFVIQAIVFYHALKRLNQKNLFLSSLIIDIVMPVVYFYLHFINVISSKSIKWK